MNEPKYSNVNEQLLAARMLILGAKNACDSMDEFVKWVLTGFGAALTFLLAQPNNGISGLREAGSTFLWAAMLGVVQRYMAMIVRVSTEVSQQGEKLHDGKVQVDPFRLLIIYLQNTPKSVRWAGAYTANKMLAGDFVSHARLAVKLSLMQNMLGAIITVMLLVAAFSILRGL